MDEAINENSPFYAAHMRSMKKFIAIAIVLLGVYMYPVHVFVEPYFQSKYGSLLLFPMLFVAVLIIGFSYYVALKLTPLTPIEKENLRADFERFMTEQKQMKAMSDEKLLEMYNFVSNNNQAVICAELDRRGIKPI